MINLDADCRWCRAKIAEQEWTAEGCTRTYECGTYVTTKTGERPRYHKCCNEVTNGR